MSDMECIEFSGYRNEDGYGKVSHKGKVRWAHRVAYCKSNSIDISEIDGMVVMHICDNPSCINPNHLALGTQADNVKDMFDKNRQNNAHPKNTFNAKITKSDALYIKENYKPRDPCNGGVAMSKKFGISRGMVSMIVNGKCWNE